jgi:hypothetical protein
MRKTNHSRKKPTPLLRAVCLLPSLGGLLYFIIRLSLNDKVALNDPFTISIAVWLLIDISLGGLLSYLLFVAVNLFAPKQSNHDSVWFTSDSKLEKESSNKEAEPDSSA